MSSGYSCCSRGVTLVLDFIFLIIVLGIIAAMCAVPPFAYAVLSIIALAIIAVICFSAFRGKKRNGSLLLPTSAQQAGDASDIRNAPDGNAPAFAQHDGRGESVVLQLPPPAVVRYNGGSNLRPASSPLLPMYMDGKDG
jgi:hypothetical protein